MLTYDERKKAESLIREMTGQVVLDGLYHSRRPEYIKVTQAEMDLLRDYFWQDSYSACPRNAPIPDNPLFMDIPVIVGE